jgi:hypothetical protein
VPARINPHPPATEQDLARLAAPLVRAGILKAADFRGPERVPSALLKAGWQRRVREAHRGAPDAMDLHLVLEPWAQLLGDASEEAAPADEGRLAITIDAGMCVIAPLDDVRAAWGEAAAGVVATALHRGLGRVVNVFDPGDLEWVAEWWQESMECYGDDDEEGRKFEEERIRDFAAAQEAVQRSYLRLRTRAELSDALRALPPGVVRRSAAALLSEARAPRRLWPCRAWERIRSGEEGYPTAAVLVTKNADDAVRHAYDEMQETSMNSGYSSPAHAVLLVDTRTPARLAASLRQLHRVLRTLSWGERLVHAVQGLHGTTR